MNSSSLRLCLLLLCFLLPGLGYAAEQSFESGERGVVLGPFQSLPAERGADKDQLAAFARGLGTLSAGEDGIAAEAFERLYDSCGWPEVAYNAGLSWYRAGRYDRSLRLAQVAGEALRDDLRVGYLEGVLLQTVGRYRDAKALMIRSLARAEEFDAPFHVAVAQLNLGASSRLLGLPEEALDSFAHAQALGEQRGMPGVAAAALMGRGRVLLSLGDRSGAEAAFAKARKLGRRSGSEAAEADSVLSQAALVLAKGQSEKAARLIETGLRSARAIADRSVRASMLLTAAGLRRKQGLAEDARSLLEEAEKLFGASGVEVGVAHAAQLRGAWARQDGRLEVAEREINRSLQIQARFQVPLAEADGRRYLGLLRADQGRFAEGEELLRSAVAVFSLARAVDEERAAQIALADVLWRAGKLGSAVAATVRALALAELSGDLQALDSIRAELAVLYAAAGDPVAAEEVFGQLSQAAQSKLSAERLGRYRVQLAESLRLAGHLEEALSSARLGLERAHETEDPEILAQAHQVLALALVELGRSEEAVTFLEREGVAEGALFQRIHTRRAIESYNEGVRALQAGDYPRAVERFDALAHDARVDAARRQTALKSLQSALGLAAQSQAGSGQSEAAQALYERAGSVAQERKDNEGRANIHLQLSVLRSGADDLAGAIAHAAKAAALADEAGDAGLAGQSWTMLGDLRFDSDVPGAQQAYRKALAAWGDDESVLGRRANVAYNLAALEAHAGDPAAAVSQFTEARKLALRAGDEGLAARIDQILLQLESE